VHLRRRPKTRNSKNWLRTTAQSGMEKGYSIVQINSRCVEFLAQKHMGGFTWRHGHFLDSATPKAAEAFVARRNG
jgi:hypothetical protein